MSTTNTSTQQVYRGHGEHSVHVPVAEDVDREDMRVPTIADMVPASWIMTRDVVCARVDLDIDALVELVVRRRLGCVPVVDQDGCPIGMVTKQDLVEHLLDRNNLDVPTTLEVRQLMMPLALTLDEHATIAHVAAMMSVEGIHHVGIVAESGCLIGVVSALDIVRWLAANDGVLGSLG